MMLVYFRPRVNRYAYFVKLKRKPVTPRFLKELGYSGVWNFSA